MDQRLDTLSAIAPVDGRYWDVARPVSGFFSESALVRERLHVEVEYFLALLAELGVVVPIATQVQLRALTQQWDDGVSWRIKHIESSIGHDLKACEYFLKECLAGGALAVHVEKVHLGLTSEDVNNLAYSRMHRGLIDSVLWPAFLAVLARLRDLALQGRAVGLLARTHGQPASPTTVGKEIGVFIERLVAVLEELQGTQLTAKVSGATGTYAALDFAIPGHDWLDFSRRFIEAMGFRPLLVTTQIEPHDTLVQIFDHCRHLSDILVDLSQDIWLYISRGVFSLNVDPKEVGSSTMPHKVNPVNFETAEGNLGMAIALFGFFSSKLTRSRWQRDLSDSTVMRNAGLAYSYLLIALDHLDRGLAKLQIDSQVLATELQAHPEVLAEAFATVLRAHGSLAPYERLKDLTRGRQVTLDSLRNWVMAQDLPSAELSRLLELTPESYLGLAPELTDQAVAGANRLLLCQEPGS